MASIKIKGDTSGDITISAPAVAGTNTLTLPASTSTIATDGPSFSAKMGSNQTVSASTFTKMQVNSEDWDTDSKYDATTNYRFTPTVSGYYQFNMAMRGSSSTTNIVALYKNGAVYKRKVVEGSKYAQLTIIAPSNTTDYFECWGYTTGTTLDANSVDNNFQAMFVRPL